MERHVPSRRWLLSFGAAATLCSQPQTSLTSRVTADESLKALLDGNERFVLGKAINPRRTPKDFSGLAAHQAPEAVIVGCSDSRVPPEILFDQGVGDLFVIRVAGNLVNAAEAGVIGSMAYAVLVLGTPLIMVLGHSNCGAVQAALEGKKDSLPASIRELVGMVQTGQKKNLTHAIAANVRAGVARAKATEPNLSRLVQKGQLKVVGAVYDLASGRVSVVS
jgi:carbonic anhydrase